MDDGGRRTDDGGQTREKDEGRRAILDAGYSILPPTLKLRRTSDAGYSILPPTLKLRRTSDAGFSIPPPADPC
jgi:hypothetical protein